MRALLINPHKLVPKSFSLTQRSSPPLGLAYIAAACESAGFEVEILDCIAEAPEIIESFQGHEDVLMQGIPFDNLISKYKDERFDLIGLTCMFSNNWLANRALMDELKIHFPNAIIVAGGEHITGAPELCLSTCEGLDLCVSGEGEEIIVDICRHLLEGKSLKELAGIVYKDRSTNEIHVNERKKRIMEIDELARPAWHLFPLDKYHDNGLSWGIQYGKSLPIFATRGCPFSCTFCSSPDMWGTKYLMRAPNDVLEEIKFLHKEYGITNFDFYDLTAIIKKQWILDFCKGIEENNLDITWQIPGGTRSEAIDFEVAQNLYKTGCKNITYAPESGSERTLKKIKKKVNLSNMLRSIQGSNKANLNIKINIIIGFPDETLSDILKTFKFLIKAAYYGVDDAAPSMFNPYPGSQIFKDLVAEGRVKLDDEYFLKMVYTQSFHKFENYNKHLSMPVMAYLMVMGYLTFYISSFLFHPSRVYKIIRNVITENYEGRSDYMLGDLLRKKKVGVAKTTG